MSYTIDIVCLNEDQHPPRTLTTMVKADVFGDELGWSSTDPRADLTENPHNPRDGYAFRCRCGKGVTVARGGLHDRLDRIRQSRLRVLTLDGVQEVLTLDGLKFLRRTQDDPLSGPQPLEPLADAGGFLMSGES